MQIRSLIFLVSKALWMKILQLTSIKEDDPLQVLCSSCMEIQLVGDFPFNLWLHYQLLGQSILHLRNLPRNQCG